MVDCPTRCRAAQRVEPEVSVTMNPTIDYSQLPLRDIHLPGAIGWWPPALGWWLLAALVLVGARAATPFITIAARHKRAALRAMTRVHAALEQGAEPVACLQCVSTILRRFAMTSVARAARRAEALDVAGVDRRALAPVSRRPLGANRVQRGRWAAAAGRAVRAAEQHRARRRARAHGALHCVARRAAGDTAGEARLSHVDAGVVVDVARVAAAVARAPLRAARAARPRRGAQGARRRGVRGSRRAFARPTPRGAGGSRCSSRVWVLRRRLPPRGRSSSASPSRCR